MVIAFFPINAGVSTRVLRAHRKNGPAIWVCLPMTLVNTQGTSFLGCLQNLIREMPLGLTVEKDFIMIKRILVDLLLAFLGRRRHR